MITPAVPIVFLLFNMPFSQCLGMGSVSSDGNGNIVHQVKNDMDLSKVQAQFHHQKCERITVALCEDAPYNYTRMPNMLGHKDQQMVSIAVQEFQPLVEVHCSEHLKFFLCSVFTPMCTENVDTTITSCRSVCEEVKRTCNPLLKKFGFEWPDILTCSKFPPKAPGSLCMDPLPESGMQQKGEENRRSGHSNVGIGGGDHYEKCPSEFISLLYTEPSKRCGLRCDRNWMFKSEHKQFVEWWMAAWSIACVVVTAFTVITFCLDTSRFRYPERSIVFLSICYNFYSWGYLLRFIFGPAESSCQQWKNGERYLIVGGLDNPKCVIVFMILYYFGTASAIWWVVLTFTWFLAAAHKWGQEAIALVSSYFHLAAWGIPALLTIAVLITHQVDASELNGLCFVGQQDSRALLGFVIAPMTFFLVVGIGFIVAGFAAMIRIRREIRNRSRDTTDVHKLEKLMVKIGIFSMLYVLPALTVIGCGFYEKSVMDEWSHSAYVSFCSNRYYTNPDSDQSIDHHHENDVKPAGRLSSPVQQVQGVDAASAGGDTVVTNCMDDWLQYHSRPTVDVYIVKIFMTLIVGITSGMWVWSKKTCDTWRSHLPCLFSSTCRVFTGPTGVKAATQSIPAVGVPLLASGDQLSSVQQQDPMAQQRTHQPSTSYHHHHHRHPRRHSKQPPSSSCVSGAPMPLHTYNGAGTFPRPLYTPTQSSEASARI